MRMKQLYILVIVKKGREYDQKSLLPLVEIRIGNKSVYLLINSNKCGETWTILELRFVWKAKIVACLLALCIM